MPNNLFLIGYRGSGKSTVAPLVATLLNMDSVDIDDQIQTNAGLSIAEIFARSGESEFRRLESEAIANYASRSGFVVALGGGAPMSVRNQNVIAISAKTVFLKATTNVLWSRISADSNTAGQRPALTNLDGRNEVEQLLKRRNPVYEACADYTISVDSLRPQEIVNAIVRWWQSGR